MNKLRLDKFLNMGYKLVAGDVVTKLTGDTTTVSNNNASIYNNPKQYGADRRFVHSLCTLDMDEIIDASKGAGTRKKQCKTVVDAVNYLQGDLESGFMGCELGCTHVICANCGSFFAVNGEVHDDSKLICTIEEFNQCVKDMSRHNTSFETFKGYLDNNSPLEIVKPRMNVEYVKVSWNCYSELFVALENNEVLFTAQAVELTIVSLAMCIEQGKEVYRKVETEITWKDELEACLNSCSQLDGGSAIGDVLFKAKTDEQRLYDKEFIEMCHLVSSLTK